MGAFFIIIAYIILVTLRDTRMDEFSWFVGLYEGEGSLYSRKWKKTHKKTGKVYEGAQIALTIKMVDEDVIARAAKFLGVSYHISDKKYTEKMGRKTIYRTRKNGGLNGDLRKLLDRMYPHLSKRRQEQIDAKLLQGQELLN